MKTGLDSFRTRWRRWLGQKTRRDSPAWTTLLDSTWLGWVDYVQEKCNLPYTPIRLSEVSREQVKDIWITAIDAADMNMLRKLDAIYSAEKLDL